nr:hypothetical protein [uncultured Amphritea sp.]
MSVRFCESALSWSDENDSKLEMLSMLANIDQMLKAKDESVCIQENLYADAEV